MDEEVRWERVEYESRLDTLADDLPEFIDAVLGTIDYEAARASERRWAIVVQFFGGCVEAAYCQDSAHGGRHHPAVGRIDAAFPGAVRGGSGPEASAGFAEFMEWLSDPSAFRPMRLRPLLEQAELGTS